MNSKIYSECRKHRMTYEQAGVYYRAIKENVSAFSNTGIAILYYGLCMPDGSTFAEFLEANANRLQLYDTEKKLCRIITSGPVASTTWTECMFMNRAYYKWEYVEESERDIDMIELYTQMYNARND